MFDQVTRHLHLVTRQIVSEKTKYVYRIDSTVDESLLILVGECRKSLENYRQLKDLLNRVYITLVVLIRRILFMLRIRKYPQSYRLSMGDQ